MTKPLLTLESIDPADRPVITIDAVRYDLAVRDDFGLIESARMARLLRVSQGMTEEALASPADKPVDRDLINRLEALLDEQISLIVRAPAEVLAKLNSSQKLEIIAAFTAATAERTTAPLPNRKRRRPTSGSSSPSLRRPTARRTGSPCRSAS